MLRTTDLDYDLPERLIAMRPAQPRDSARMMIVRRSGDSHVEFAQVRDMPSFVRTGDVMVFNASRVLPARLEGARRDSGGGVSGLFLEARADGAWRVLLRSNGRLRMGMRIDITRAHEAGGLTLVLLERDAEAWIVRPLDADTGDELRGAAGIAALHRWGATPLPPYILRARRAAGAAEPDEVDRAWYQTVYADSARAGSVAAPTAGLHFTPELLAALDGQGVRRLDVALHVGAGTFKPVEAETVEAHAMHSEVYTVPPSTAQCLKSCARSGRLFAVGTTSARAIESLPDPIPEDAFEHGWTDSSRLLITPGYQWRFVEGMLTNFHLPRSTLMAMVASLLPGGVEQLRALYRLAIEREMRFYSYGDAMLILP